MRLPGPVQLAGYDFFKMLIIVNADVILDQQRRVQLDVVA